MSAKKIDMLVASIIAGRESYINTFEETKKAAEKKREEARNSFVKDRLKTELANIDQEEEDTIKTARAEAMEKVASWAQAIREEERKAVNIGTFDLRAFEELRAIGEMDISAEEFTSICQRYGKNGYWSKRMLNNIAQKNGLPYAAALSIDEKLHIVRELTNGFSDFLKVFNGRGKNDIEHEEVAHALAAVSNEVLTRAAAKFVSADSFGTLSDDRAAACAYDAIRGADSFTAGMRLRNFTQNAPENAKNLLLFRLLIDTNVPAQVYQFAGIDTEDLRAHYTERMEEYKQAGKNMDFLKRSENMQDDMQRLLVDDPNGYLLAMVKSEARGNKAIREAGEELGIIEQEEETEEGAE